MPSENPNAPNDALDAVRTSVRMANTYVIELSIRDLFVMTRAAIIGSKKTI